MSGIDSVSDAVAHAVRAVHDDLAGCPDLRPGPRVDAAFGRLVHLVVAGGADDARVLAHPAVREVAASLRAMCLAGEHLLEEAWAPRIAAGPRPRDELERFPYVDNYRQLSAMEADTLARLDDGAGGRAIWRAAFVGSGPLPVTAFLMAGAGGVRVDCLERDPTAIDLSRRAASALGLVDLAVRQVDVAADPADPVPADLPVDLASYDLVVLAAMVGTTPEHKAHVIAHLAAAMSPGALLLARSARGLRTLLYPEIDPASLGGFEVLGVTHPTGEVINSVIVARARKDR